MLYVTFYDVGDFFRDRKADAAAATPAPDTSAK
jgi:hypothetical protein